MDDENSPLPQPIDNNQGSSDVPSLPAIGISGNRSSIFRDLGVNKRSMGSDAGTEPPEKRRRREPFSDDDDDSVNAPNPVSLPIQVPSTADNTNAPNSSPSAGSAAPSSPTLPAPVPSPSAQVPSMPAAGISGNRSTISSNAGVNKRSMRNDTGTKPPEKKMRLDATASDDASVSAQLFAPWPIRVGSTASSTNAPNPSPSVGTSATNPSQAAQTPSMPSVDISVQTSSIFSNVGSARKKRRNAGTSSPMKRIRVEAGASNGHSVNAPNSQVLPSTATSTNAPTTSPRRDEPNPGSSDYDADDDDGSSGDTLSPDESTTSGSEQPISPDSAAFAASVVIHSDNTTSDSSGGCW